MEWREVEWSLSHLQETVLDLYVEHLVAPQLLRHLARQLLLLPQDVRLQFVFGIFWELRFWYI